MHQLSAFLPAASGVIPYAAVSFSRTVHAVQFAALVKVDTEG